MFSYEVCEIFKDTFLQKTSVRLPLQLIKLIKYSFEWQEKAPVTLMLP